MENRVVFKLTKIPDLSLSKYAAYESSTQDELLKKQLLFLKQLYGLCNFYQIDAHLLYSYDYDENISKGKHLSCYLYFNVDNNINVEIIRSFVEKSILEEYFSFEFLVSEEKLDKARFKNYAFLTKDKIEVTLKRKEGGSRINKGVGIRDWQPNESGRIYNLLKLLEQVTGAMIQSGGKFNAFRVDLFPVNSENVIQSINSEIDRYYKSVYSVQNSKDYAAEILLNSFIDLNKKFTKNLIFKTNIIAFSDSADVARIMMDYVGNEAIEEGLFDIQNGKLEESDCSVFWHDSSIVCNEEEIKEYPILDCKSIFTINELNPIFSLPVLYPAESIEFLKESDPIFDDENAEYINLGDTDRGYGVKIPLDILTKHTFISGVPGAGKTYTMFHMLTELWDRHNVPFIVFEPAKKEYRELLNVNNKKFKDISFFSPSFKTRFALHINPFEFPQNITLDEHLSNLLMVFKGAFHFPDPGTHLLEESLLKIYEKLNWKAHTINTGNLKYPTMDDLYMSFEEAIATYKYDDEVKGRLEAILKVRIGSLLRRTGGDVYNVASSTIRPEEWIERPVIIELEQLGKDRSNFMVLLICAIIRETLSAKELSRKKELCYRSEFSTKLKHLIFIEEAHNLIGVRKENIEESADPKVAATNFIVDMLAEVRNLGEGIVIADQLPSVMAPEVLKNTSLKIAHRLTAKDDRDNLGSTMSSTHDQIETQAVLTAGEAFVYYEGLSKSFRMKIKKWNPKVENSYAKDDNELYEYLCDSRYYNKNITKNFQIRQDKFINDLSTIYNVEIQQIKNNDYYSLLNDDEAAVALTYIYSKLYETYANFVDMKPIFNRQFKNTHMVDSLLVHAKTQLISYVHSYVIDLMRVGIPSSIKKKVFDTIDGRTDIFTNNEFVHAEERSVELLSLVANRYKEDMILIKNVFNN